MLLLIMCTPYHINYVHALPTNRSNLAARLNSQESMSVMLRQGYNSGVLRDVNLRSHIRRVVEVVLLHLGTQHVFQVKRFSTFKPCGVVGIDREACWCMRLFMNLLGPKTNMRKCTTLVKGPAIDMVPVM